MSADMQYIVRITCTYVKIGLAYETTMTYVHALITCQCGTDVLIVSILGTMERPYYLVLIDSVATWLGESLYMLVQ